MQSEIISLKFDWQRVDDSSTRRNLKLKSKQRRIEKLFIYTVIVVQSCTTNTVNYKYILVMAVD